MVGHATQRKLSAIGMLVATAAVGTGAALLSGTGACTLTQNDALLDASRESDALKPRVSVCNACSVQQCTGQWAVCLQSADCFAMYACAHAGKPQDCVCAGPAAGRTAYRALAACGEVSACRACNAQCKEVASRLDCAKPGVPLALDVCGRDAGADAATDAPASDADPDASVDAAILDADVDASASDAATPIDAATGDADAGPPPLGDCTGCVDASCGDAKRKCAVGTSCEVYVQCASACADAACLERCGLTYASGKVALAEVAKCANANCSTACGF
jgi:hypothetical protein